MSLTAARHAGLLVPLFSVPSSRSWGIGEIGDVPLIGSWLRDAHQDLLQLLPLNEMAVGQRSPYSAMTAMAIDPIYISVHAMKDFAAIGGERAMGVAWNARLEEARRAGTIDYALARSVKDQALRASFERFRTEEWDRSSPRAGALRRWSRAEAWWLRDYALFRALHWRHGERPWNQWPEPIGRRDQASLDQARHDLAGEILYREWLQWIAGEQWRSAKERSRPVSLLGDLPFMVDGDSADVWANADAFRLDASVGAPPDAFSEDGQNWGMPVCRWEAMAAGDFAWLRARARRSVELFDGYRVDHLVGFYRTYVFPNDGSPSYFTPAGQADQLALGERVLRILAASGARVVAEDLGTVPDFVRSSLARLGIAGYKVLRWEREWHLPGQPYRDPAAYAPVSLATSGTHDTEPMAAWWDGLDAAERRSLLEAPGLAARLPHGAEGGDVYSPAIRDDLLGLLFASGSDLLVLPIQDVFGWRDRINVPASLGDHNWTWKLPWPVDALSSTPEARERTAALRRWSDGAGRWAGARSSELGARS